MAVRPRRDPWYLVWRVAVAAGTLAGLLIVTAITLATAALIPQIPLGDAVAYARRISSLQARFGSATQAMRSLGLFSITRSWGFRTLVALIAGCTLLRSIEISGRSRGRAAGEPGGDAPAPSRCLWSAVAGDTLSLLAHAGGLLLIGGLVIAQVSGWQKQGIVLQAGSRVGLPGRDAWVAMTDEGLVSHSPGVRVLAEEWGPGALVRAVDAAGQQLELQQNPESKPALELPLALVRDPDLATRDAVVAIPEAQLIVRLLPQDGAKGDAPGGLIVQAYRSPSGELATEAVVVGDAAIEVGNVTLEIVGSPYVQLTVARNPGAWPTAVGVIVLLFGRVAKIAWRPLDARRSDSGTDSVHQDVLAQIAEETGG